MISELKTKNNGFIHNVWENSGMYLYLLFCLLLYQFLFLIFLPG